MKLIPLEEDMSGLLARAADAEVRDIAEKVMRQSLEFYRGIGAVAPWTGYLALDESRDLVVGTCGFKGNPSEEGEVEIAYFTFPPFEGAGMATAMAAALLEVAADSKDVRTVIAHTLPERNPSTSILTKLGFQYAGEAQDDEAGLVWRWERKAEG